MFRRQVYPRLPATLAAFVYRLDRRVDRCSDIPHVMGWAAAPLASRVFIEHFTITPPRMAAHNGKFSLIDNRHGSGSALVLSVITVTESRVFRTAAHACSFTESGRALGPRSLIASGQRRERKGRIERDNVAPAVPPPQL